MVSVWIGQVWASLIAFPFVEIKTYLAHATKFNGACQAKHTFFDGLLTEISIGVDNEEIVDVFHIANLSCFVEEIGTYCQQ